MGMHFMQTRSPIVIEDVESSDEESDEEPGVQESIAISRVVSQILGRESLEDSEVGLFDDPRDVRIVSTGVRDAADGDKVGDGDTSPVGFQEKEKSKDFSKKEKDKIVRKDVVSSAKLAENKMKEIFKYPCCDNLCLRKLGLGEVKKHRNYYYRLIATERNVLLRGCMRNSHNGRTGYQVLGEPFCRVGFKKLFSLGNNRLRRVSQDIFLKIENEVFCKEKSTTHLALVQWLKQFFALNVESLPNKDIFHLPDNWTKLEVFDAFKNERRGAEADLSLVPEEMSVTYSWFCRIWGKEFPRVRIPKRSRFSTCAPCTEFKALRDKATLEGERRMYTDLLNQHRKTQGVERVKLAKHREKCYRNPEKYLGICIDGMDQKKTELPHFLRCPKNMDEKYFIPIHVVGCLVINGTLRSRVFLNYPNVHNDSNLTIHVIQHILNQWEGVLPSVLYVQLDNTSRENKNKYVMAYFNMLVEKGIFQKIKVGFLLVGHTHDQIDQMFSRFSSKLNKQRAFRLETLKEIIMDSYKPRPEIEFVDEVADFRKFLSDKNQPNSEGLVGNVLIPLNGIRDQKQFRIKEVEDNGVTRTAFHAKHLSTTQDWGEPVPFVRYIPLSPMWVAPQMPLKCATGGGSNKQLNHAESEDNDDEAIVASNHLITLGKYKKAIIDEGFHYFRDEDKLWWVKFFENQEEILTTYLKPAQWRFEWSWPRKGIQARPTPVEIVQPVSSDLLEKVAGPHKAMYSGRRKATPAFGDFRDLETKTKYAMICVKAQGDPKGKVFWVARVTDILTRVEGVPDKIKITWFNTDAEDNELDGKYFPEKSKSSQTFLEDELCLSETTVYAYNFSLLGNKSLPATTKRIIKAAMQEGSLEG